MSNDSISKTFLVAALLCIVCSVIVSSSAVSLRPDQERNKLLDKKQNILAAAGLFQEGADIEKIFTDNIEAKLVNLETGEYDTSISVADYDQRKAAKDPATSKVIENDNSGIGRRAKLAPVYLVKNGANIERFILPVHGKGLWSTLYGFLAIDVDFNTIKALSFYEHAETPGLGGEVDNPKWKALWDGKKIYGADGRARINVIKGKVDTSKADAVYQVDGLSGATITARGVGNMLQYWLSDDAYGKFIENRKLTGF